MRANVTAEYSVQQHGFTHRAESVPRRYKNIAHQRLVGWATPVNWKRPLCFICVPIFVIWNASWMKPISSPRPITTWTGSKEVLLLRILPGMMIQKQVRMAQGVMAPRRKVACGLRPPSKRRQTTSSRSTSSMSGANNGGMRVMGYGENLKPDNTLTAILKNQANFAVLKSCTLSIKFRAAVTRINPTGFLSGSHLFTTLLLPQMPVFLILRIQIAWINFFDDFVSMRGPELGRQLAGIRPGAL